MRNHKILISTLVAAAAAAFATAPAQASITVDDSGNVSIGSSATTTTTAPSTSSSAATEVSTDTIYTSLTAGSTYYLNLSSDAGVKFGSSASDNQENTHLNISGTGDVWISNGRFGSSTFTNTGKIYVAGGQLFVSGTYSQDFYLGTSNWSEGNAFGNAALRVSGATTLSGTTTILSGGSKVGLHNDSLTISKLAGSGTLTVSNFTGNSTMTISESSGFSGGISLIAGNTTLVFVGSSDSTTTVTHNVGALAADQGAGSGTAITVDSGANVTATSLTNSWGISTLTVNGTLNVSGNFQYSSGNMTNTITGTGTISAGTFTVGNVGAYVVDGGVTLNIGSGGIAAGSAVGYTLTLKNATIGASANWTAAALQNAITLGATGDSATTFNTNSHTITLNNSLIGGGNLKKTGDGTLNVNGTATNTLGTVTVEAGTLAISSAATLGSLTVSGGTVNLTGAVYGGDPTTISGATTVSGGTLTANEYTMNFTGDVSVADGAKLSSVGAHTTFGGAVTVASGATLALEGIVTLSQAISNSGTVTLNKNSYGMTFNLDNLTPVESEDGNTKTFTVISGSGTIVNWSSDTVSYNYSGKSARQTVSFGTTGTISFTGSAYNLFWKGGTTGTFEATATNWGKDSTSGEDTAFVSYDNVTFETANASITLGDSSVYYVGNITVSEDMTLAKNSTVSQTFLAKSLTVKSGKTLTLTPGGSTTTLNTFNFGTMTLESGATLDIGTFSAEGTTSATVNWSDTGRKLTGEGALKIAFGTGDYDWDNRVLLSDDSTGTVNVAAGYFSLNNSSIGSSTWKLTGGASFRTKSEATVSNAIVFADSANTSTMNIAGDLTLSGNVSLEENVSVTRDGGSALTFSGGISGATGSTLSLTSGTTTISGGTNSLATLAVSDGTFKITGGTTTATNLNISGGTTTISNGTNTLGTLAITGGSTTISGGATSATNLNISGGTTTISNGTNTLGTLAITGGSTTISGGATTTSSGTIIGGGDSAATLTLSSGGQTSALRGTVTIKNNGTLSLDTNDATGWGSSNNISALRIEEGGTLNITTDATGDSGNQTFNMSGGITLQGGTISGVENAKFDLYNSSTGITTLASATTATISTAIGLRSNGTFTVADGTTSDGVDLLVSGRLTSKNKITTATETFTATLTKAGAGTMKLTGDNSNWTTGGTVSAGKLIAASTTALGTGALAVSSGATLEIAVGASETLTYAGNLTSNDGAGTLEISSGTLKLTSTSNSFRGAINIGNGGVLEITDSATLNSASQSSSTSNVITVKTGGELKISSFNWGGSLGKTSDRAHHRVLDGGKISITGTTNETNTGQAFTVNSNGGTFEVTSKTLTLSGNQNTNTIVLNGALEIGGAGNIVVNKNDSQVAIAGAGSLTKIGAGTLTINSAGNTYSGGTIVGEGTLVVGAADALGTGNVTVASGATLKAAADVTFSSGKSLTVYAGSETPLIDTDGSHKITIASGATLYIDISQLASATATTTDGTTKTLTIATANALEINDIAASLKIGTLSDDDETWIEDTNWSAVKTTFDASAGTLTLVAIPEPSAFGLLAGLGALALAISRRRRNHKKF